jgi:transposase-like protein
MSEPAQEPEKTVRRQFTAEEKSAALRSHHLDRKPISDICTALDISPVTFYEWQQQLFINAPTVMERKRQGGRASPEAKRIEELEGRLAHKDRVISELLDKYTEIKKKNLKA